MEEIDKDFDRFRDMMRWNLIQKHYIDALKLEVTPERLPRKPRKWPPPSSLTTGFRM